MMRGRHEQIHEEIESENSALRETRQTLRLPVGCCLLNRSEQHGHAYGDDDVGLDIRGERFCSSVDLQFLSDFEGTMVRFDRCVFEFGGLPAMRGGDVGAHEWLREITLLLVDLFARAAIGRSIEIWLDYCTLSIPSVSIPSSWPPSGSLKVLTSAKNNGSSLGLVDHVHAFHWELAPESGKTMRLMPRDEAED